MNLENQVLIVKATRKGKKKKGITYKDLKVLDMNLINSDKKKSWGEGRNALGRDIQNIVG